MKLSKKLLSLVLSAVMVASMAATAMAADEYSIMPISLTAPSADGVIKILYTNDTHSYINNTSTVKAEDGTESKVPGIRFSTVAAYKQASGADLLVDAGDHIQGTVYGVEDNGATIIKLMNAAGYDLATLGNHEFDYGMDGTMNAISWANFPYVSSNLTHNGELVLAPYKVFEVEGKKVAFVGVTTPESFTKSTPKYFMDAAGNIVYSFGEGGDGAALFAAVQKAIDAAAVEADYVIGLGHMGIDEASIPYTSKDVIARTTGLTAFIDGHSHSEVPMEMVADKSGKQVPLTQTGNYLNNIGEMTIDAAGTVSSRLVSFNDLAVTPDPTVAAIEDEFISMVDKKLDEPIGATAVNLTISGPDGKRSIRKEETNLGNFCLDALMYEAKKAGFDPDLAFVQGGGIRATLAAGPITLKHLKTCYPWDGENTIKDVTGQELLDAFEWSYRTANVENTNEVGGFLQLSGARVWVNRTIPSTVQQSEQSIWTGGPTGAYRVQKVEIQNKTTGAWEPLDLNKTYSVVCGTYIFEEMGDGYNMFKTGAPSSFVCPDYMALLDYIQSFPVDPATGLHTVPVGAGYDEFVHTGRINYVDTPVTSSNTESEGNAPAATTTPNSYTVVKGDNLSKLAARFLGDATKWRVIYNANKATIKDPNLIYIGQTLVIPTV